MSYLYLITREDEIDYNEYDSYVVCADSAEDALQVHPSFKMGDPDALRYTYFDGSWYLVRDGLVDAKCALGNGRWTGDIDSLKVEMVGNAQGAYMLGRVICSSFNTG